MRPRLTLLAAAILAACAACAGTDSSGAVKGGASGAAPSSSSADASSGRVAGAPAGDAVPATASASTHFRGWTTYHGDQTRAGFAASPPRVRSLRVRLRMKLDGAVYAQPVLAPSRGGSSPIVATEQNSVYAVRHGHVVWRTRLGAPVPRRSLPCGNIDPLGITGTPVVDAAHFTVYLVAERAAPIRHELVALDTRTGAVRWRRVVDPRGSQPRFEQQRAALALSGGRVWVALGGLAGDCGPYHGKVVGVRTDGRGSLAVHQVPSRREAGIWAPSGPSVAADGHLFVAVGNGEATSGAWDGSDSILELDAAAKVVSSFTPATWRQENAADLDLGSMGPLLLPNGLVLAAGKAGDVYVLRQGQLGGIGHPLASWHGCTAFGGPAADVRAAGRGSATVFLPCSSGVAALRVNLRSGTVSRLWRAEAGTNGTPVVVGDTVLAIDNSAGRLVALDSATGARRSAVAVGDVSRFATPLMSGATVVLGTMDGLVEIALAS